MKINVSDKLIKKTISSIMENFPEALDSINETTRIEFAERHGWKWVSSDNGYAWGVYDSTGKIIIRYDGNKYEHLEVLPDLTNHNHVHTALMGMGEEEWKHLGNRLIQEIHELPEFGSNSTLRDMIIQTLKTPLPILVSCYLEATKGRVNANRP